MGDGRKVSRICKNSRKSMGTAELHYIIGGCADGWEREMGVKGASFLAAAYRAGVPVYTSSPGDSAIGMVAAGEKLIGSRLRLDPLTDVNETSAIVYGAKQAKRGKSAVIMIGGGSKKILTYAGQEADVVSLNFNNRAGTIGLDGMNSGLADATAKKIRWIKEGAGDRFNELEIEIGAYTTMVTDQQQPTAAALGEALGMSAEDILSHPHCLIGSTDFICEELQRRREAYGISYIAVLDDGENNMAETFAPVVARLAGK